jgi:phage terminase large subunit
VQQALADISDNYEQLSDDQIEEILIPYEPRPYQAVLHNELKRFNLLVCHRRFGKTVFSIMEMIDRAFRNDKRNPQYAYIAPTYGQAKRVAWEYLKYYCANLPNCKANEAELRIDVERENADGTKDKVRFILLGAENPDSLRGIYLDGCILDEYAQCPPSIWGEVIRPALSDRKGWAIFIGTPKGQNHFFDMLEKYTALMATHGDTYYSAIYRASETGVLDAEELMDAQATMTEEEYLQEYECDFNAALIGSYYGKYISEMEKQGRIIDFAYDPNTPVRTAWDLGISDTTVIWFYQVIGREIRILDYFEDKGMGLEHYARELQARKYIYDPWGHGIPHDGAAKELGTGKTRQEQLLEFGINTHIIERQSIMDGIHAARMLLQNPNTYMHKTNCADGLKALKNYQRTYDKRKAMFLNKPLHNWASNGADGFRYLALDVESPSHASIRNISPRQMTVENEYDEFA